MKLLARRALASLFLAAGLALSGCGGADSNPPQVSFSEKVAAGTVENYTNADWLFQNYLGDYGLPQEVKPAFMPALKLLANGFMLQFKSGQDVRANIEQVHALFLQFIASGEAAKFFTQVQSDFEQRGAVVTTAMTSSVPAGDPPDIPYISPEDQAQIAAAKLRDAKERQDILDMAKKYGLPYHIDEHQEQWFIYSPTMKGGGKGSPTPAPTPPPDEPKGHSSVKQWGLRRGDLLWVSGTGSIAGVPGHNAIVFNNEKDILFIDANTDVGVSLHRDVQEWVDRYAEVRALTPRLTWDPLEFSCYLNFGGAYGCPPDSWQRQHAWDYAVSVQGAPYNWNFLNPRDTTRFYCSSLVWNAYDQANYNVIAPLVLGEYGLITPNLIRDSEVVRTIKVSTK